MPDGKPAGVVCVNLEPGTYRCRVWGTAGYPAVCRGLVPMREMCGASREEAIEYLTWLEEETGPAAATRRGSLRAPTVR